MATFFWIVFLTLAGLVGLSFIPAFGPVRNFTGYSLFFGGYGLAIFVGFYVMFVGGFINVVDGVKDNPTNTGLIVWGLIRGLILSGLFGRLIIMGTNKTVVWFADVTPED